MTSLDVTSFPQCFSGGAHFLVTIQCMAYIVYYKTPNNLHTLIKRFG